LVSVATIGKETTPVAFRASANVVDRFARQTDRAELGANDLSEIDVRPGAATAIDDVDVRGASGELLCHVMADLETANLDVRSDRGHQIAGVADLAPQRGNSRFDDVGDGSLPAAVDGGHRAALSIGDQDRYAIGDLHATRHPSRAREHHVRFAPENLLPRLVAAERDRFSSVYLIDHVEALGFDAERSRGGFHVRGDGSTIFPGRPEM
jgi:hypothetical protein